MREMDSYSHALYHSRHGCYCERCGCYKRCACVLEKWECVGCWSTGYALLPLGTYTADGCYEQHGCFSKTNRYPLEWIRAKD